jgi:hypothetical protein
VSDDGVASSVIEKGHAVRPENEHGLPDQICFANGIATAEDAATGAAVVVKQPTILAGWRVVSEHQVLVIGQAKFKQFPEEFLLLQQEF